MKYLTDRKMGLFKRMRVLIERRQSMSKLFLLFALSCASCDTGSTAR